MRGRRRSNRPGRRVGLRDATWPIHQRLEALWTPGGGFSSEKMYLRFLVALLDAHRSLGGPASRALRDADAQATEGQRVMALMGDLGIADPVAGGPTSMDPDEAWGVCYVLNGSALGATFLLKGDLLSPDWPTSYLRLGQAYVRSGQLKRFFDALEDCPSKTEAVTKGAESVLSLLLAHANDFHPETGSPVGQEAQA